MQSYISSSRCLRMLLLAALLRLAAAGHAQWTTTDLYVPGHYDMEVASGAQGMQVGFFDNANGSKLQACMWQGSSNTFVDLSGGASSVAYATDGAMQGGELGGSAGLWSGSSGSFSSLNPNGYTQSNLSAMAGGNQYGSAIIQHTGVNQAGFWQGSAATWTPLGPTNLSSEVDGAFGNQQVGGCQPGVNQQPGACLWNGTPNSFVSLAPAGSSASDAVGTNGSWQVGSADVNGSPTASLWEGSASSWANLNPDPGVWVQSGATSILGDTTFGWLRDKNQNFHIGIWTGDNASTWVDLTSLVPQGYSDALWGHAWLSGSTLYVVGNAMNNSSGYYHPFLWSRTVPEPSSFPALLTGLALLVGRRKWRRRVS